MNLRGQRFEQDARIAIDSAGRFTAVEVRGFTPNGNSAESYSLINGTARWVSQVDRGERTGVTEATYSNFSGPFSMIAPFVERLYSAADRRLALLPGGEARMEQIGSASIGSGANAREIQLWAINGFGLSAFPVWMEGNRFFAAVSWVSLAPDGTQSEMPRLQQLQDEALARRNPAFVQRFGQLPGAAVAFENVRLYDSENARFLEGQTVVTDGARITAVGAAGTVTVPPNARRIAGNGHTLVPGLWDAHMHFGDDAQGPMLLSLGITSARNPGADVEPARRLIARLEAGQVLAPTLFTSVLIDGAGPLAAQGGVTVTSAEEAVAAVRRAHEGGFRAIKFYTSMRPEWLRAGVAEARRLGMHVHGHVPATMRASDAMDAGYGEITHINFVAMQAMPDEVVNVSNGFARFAGPGRFARTIDLNAEPMRGLIARMARDRIVSDPTLVVFESILAAETGTLSPSYAPFEGTMPPQTERGFRQGGFAPPADLTRADYQASFRRLVELVGAMHRAGVPIVAGTDGSGLELIRELELYVQAGMTPAQALQTATRNVAQLVGVADQTGAITIGREADLVLVEGDVSTDITALRRTRWVMTDGRLINADELREAVGFSGRPR
jgi:cytosine/adenosine deaminase-related metal-dependent hydrolase